MSRSIPQELAQNFLHHTPTWYKLTILGFLLLNPVLIMTVGPFVTGWVLILEFIFTLAMALKSYPLQPGGLLAIEAVLLGMTTPAMVYHETVNNFQVILTSHVHGSRYLFHERSLAVFVFENYFRCSRSKQWLALLFSIMGAFLSAFLDALTVTAVIIAVATGFYSMYHRVASGKSSHASHDHTSDQEVHELNREDLDNFRGFLRNLMMHGAVGTALGGVCTLVGEPQNLLIADKAGWEFMEFVFSNGADHAPGLCDGLGHVSHRRKDALVRVWVSTSRTRPVIF